MPENIAILMRDANTDAIIRILVTGCIQSSDVSNLIIEGIARLVVQEWGIESEAIFLDNVDRNSRNDKESFVVHGGESVLEKMESVRIKGS